MSEQDMPLGAILAEIFSLPAQPAKREATTTDEVLVEMLGENTGAHLLDSGGAYGRNFERNAGRKLEDWRNAPEVEVEWRVYPSENATWAGARDKEPQIDLMASLNVFHFLSARLEYEPELDTWFAAYAETRTDAYWPEIIEDFFEKLNCGEGVTIVNTYNNEDALAQVIQYGIADYPDLDSCDKGSLDYGEQLVALQIHGGCDVRGGYTEPRIFKSWDFDMWDNAKLGLGCDSSGEPPQNPEQLDLEGKPVGVPNCGAQWDSDDAGCHFYDAGNGSGYGKIEDIETYPVRAGTEGERGVLVVNEEANEAFCPVCGRGKLNVYPPYASS